MAAQLPQPLDRDRQYVVGAAAGEVHRLRDSASAAEDLVFGPVSARVVLTFCVAAPDRSRGVFAGSPDSVICVRRSDIHGAATAARGLVMCVKRCCAASRVITCKLVGCPI